MAPPIKVKRPWQPAVRQYTEPLALLYFVVNETNQIFEAMRYLLTVLPDVTKK